MPINSIQAHGYRPGIDVVLVFTIPADPDNGCIADYSVRVVPPKGPSSLLTGTNAGPDHTPGDTLLVLPAAAAGAGGALFRVTLDLQQMTSGKFSFSLSCRQGENELCSAGQGGAFVPGEIAAFDFDIFCT